REAHVGRLEPGVLPSFALLLFALGAAATLAWLWLVSWRVGRHRDAIWKSLVLPAAGSTLCWLLLMTLWLPLLDFGRSYEPISRRIASLVPAQDCVLVDGLSEAQIAALRHHGGLQLVRTDPAATASRAHCASLLATPQSQASLHQRVDLTQWAFKATVRRLNDNKESLVLYQRVGG